MGCTLHHRTPNAMQIACVKEFPAPCDLSQDLKEFTINASARRGAHLYCLPGLSSWSRTREGFRSLIPCMIRFWRAVRMDAGTMTLDGIAGCVATRENRRMKSGRPRCVIAWIMTPSISRRVAGQSTADCSDPASQQAKCRMCFGITEFFVRLNSGTF